MIYLSLCLKAGFSTYQLLLGMKKHCRGPQPLKDGWPGYGTTPKGDTNWRGKKNNQYLVTMTIYSERTDSD